MRLSEYIDDNTTKSPTCTHLGDTHVSMKLEQLIKLQDHGLRFTLKL